MPRITLDVPDHTPGEGMHADWDDHTRIAVRIEDGEVYLQANHAGLRSLARLLLGLTVEGVQHWHHWHLDDLNSLEEGSAPLTITQLPDEHMDSAPSI